MTKRRDDDETRRAQIRAEIAAFDARAAETLTILARNRRDRAFGYAFLSIAAFLSAFFERSQAVTNQMGPWLQIAWVSLFSLSALACFIGAVTDWWVFEYIGLIPLLFTFAAFGVVVLAQSQTPLGWTVVPTGLSMIGFALLFRARWKDVRDIYSYVDKKTGGAK